MESPVKSVLSIIKGVFSHVNNKFRFCLCSSISDLVLVVKDVKGIAKFLLFNIP